MTSKMLRASLALALLLAPALLAAPAAALPSPGVAGPPLGRVVEITLGAVRIVIANGEVTIFEIVRVWDPRCGTIDPPPRDCWIQLEVPLGGADPEPCEVCALHDGLATLAGAQGNAGETLAAARGFAARTQTVAGGFAGALLHEL